MIDTSKLKEAVDWLAMYRDNLDSALDHHVDALADAARLVLAAQAAPGEVEAVAKAIRDAWDEIDSLPPLAFSEPESVALARAALLAASLHRPVEARVTEETRSAEDELNAYRDAAEYDATMEGPKFKGWNGSQLDRARKISEARGPHPMQATDDLSPSSVTEETASAEIEKRMNELVDLLALFMDTKIDERAWRQLLVYAPAASLPSPQVTREEIIDAISADVSDFHVTAGHIADRILSLFGRAR